MLCVGLTGGIGCGKTLVSDSFRELAVPIIDTDLIARQLVQPGQAAVQEIKQVFGTKIVDHNNQLHRSALRQQIFADEEKRKKLEAILHPRIFARVTQTLHSLDAEYCIIVIPLLLESTQNYPIDRVLVVDCPISVQIERIKQRDQQTETQIMAIINSQAKREQRLAIANDIIINDTNRDACIQQVVHCHHKYLQIIHNNVEH